MDEKIKIYISTYQTMCSRQEIVDFFLKLSENYISLVSISKSNFVLYFDYFNDVVYFERTGQEYISLEQFYLEKIPKTFAAGTEDELIKMGTSGDTQAGKLAVDIVLKSDLIKNVGFLEEFCHKVCVSIPDRSFCFIHKLWHYQKNKGHQ